MLSAKYFGASLERDAWVLGGSVVLMFTQLFFGPINETFRAKFVHIREEQGDRRLADSHSSLMGGIVLVSLIIILSGEFFPDVICSVFAPGFTESQKNVFSIMLRWLLPSLLINEITIIWIAVLNAYDSYYIPDIYSFVSGGINVVCVILLTGYIGIYSLIASSYISTIILLIILLRKIHRRNHSLLLLSLPRWEKVKPFIFISLPFYLTFVFGQIHLTIEKMLCTYIGEGSVSILDYARKFIDMPRSVIFGVVSTVLTPLLANLYSNKREDEFFDETTRFIRMIYLGVFPLVILFTVCPREMVELLLFRGQFMKEYIDVTAETLFWFGFGIIGIVFINVAGQAQIAKKQSFRFAVIASLIAIVSAVLNLLFFESLKIIIFPITWGGTLFLGGMYMYLSGKERRREKYVTVLKLLSVSIFILAAGFMIKEHLLLKLAVFNEYNNIFIIASTFMLSGILYLLLLYFLKFEEVIFAKNFVMRMVSRYIVSRK